MDNRDYDKALDKCWNKFCESKPTLSKQAGVLTLFNFIFDYLYPIEKHNLTSDAEGEEMLTVPRKKVLYMYDFNEDILICDPTHNGAKLLKAKLQELFGSKCLPDEEPKQFFESDYSIGDKVIVPISSIGEPRKEVVTLIRQYQPQCDYNDYAKQWVIQTKDGLEFQSDEMRFEPYEEPKPAEPKFKVGDKVVIIANCKHQGEVAEIIHTDDDMAASYKLDIYDDGKWYTDADLEPYIEPDTDFGKEVNFLTNEFRNLSQKTVIRDKQFDNILKDSFSKERRLNIAVQMVKAMMGCPEIIERIASAEADSLLDDILHDALYLTDRLMSECEEGGMK